MAVVETGTERPSAAEQEASGLAHLGAVSFLGSRLAPTGAFWVALAGGVAVARAAARGGLRLGIGTSVAALAQTVAIMGPTRISLPLTQAITAPLVGRMESRRTPVWAQVLAVTAIRIAIGLFWTAFFIWVILGGLDSYTGGYDWLTDRVGWLPEGDKGALLLSVVGIALWSPFASIVQVLVYRRGLQRWPEEGAGGWDAEGGAGEGGASERAGGEAPHGPGAPELAAGDDEPREWAARPRPPAASRLDPRAVTLAACVAWALLLSSTGWALLAGVTAWLALAWLVARPERDFVRIGALIAAVLGVSALISGLIAGLPIGTVLARATRAALLVAVATWFRAAAGTPGIREVSQRVLGRLRRAVPGAREAARLLGDLGSADVLLPAGRAFADELRGVPRKPGPVLDAVLRWVIEESGRFRPQPAGEPLRLSLRARDVALVLLAAAPLAALVTGAAAPGSG